MQVRCPHCSQVFTTEAPGDQPCPSCGVSIHVPDPRDLGGGPPSPGPAAAPAVRGPTPWESRGSLGFVQGWVQTFVQSTIKPQEFWPSVEPNRPFAPALMWAWLGMLVTGLVAAPFFLLNWGQFVDGFQQGIASSGAGAEGQAALDMVLSMGPLPVFLGGLIASLVLYPVLSLIMIGIVHVCAMLVGAANEGFGATARAYYYAQGPQLLGSLPVIGFVGGLYTWVLFGWGIKELHGTTAGRAVAAILLPLIVCCLGFCALGMFAFASLATILNAS